jgi:hypothetical protein
MIQIEVFSSNVEGGRAFARLFPDARASFVVDNLSLQDSVSPGEYSLPMKFPRKCINDVLFDFFHEIPKTDRKYQWKANVYFNGQIKYSGTLELLRSNDESFDGYIKILTGGLTCLDLKLPDINMGDPIDLGATLDDRIDTLSATLTQSYPDSYYALPCIKNAKFYDSQNPTYQNYLNLYDNATGKLKKPYIETSTPGTAHNPSAIVPMPYLVHVIKSGFAMSSMKASGPFLNDTEIKQLYIYNNRSLDAAYNKYKVEASLTVPFTESAPNPAIIVPHSIVLDTEVSDPDTIFDPTTGQYTISAMGYHRIRGKINFTINNPDSDTITLRMSVFKNLTGAFGSTVFYTGAASGGTLNIDFHANYFFDASDIGSTIMPRMTFQGVGGNTFSVTVNSVTASIENSSYLEWNQLTPTLDLRNHVPDITFGDLIARIRNTFNLKIDYDLLTKSVVFDFADTVFDELPIDLTLKSNPEYVFDNDSIRYKLLNYEFDSTDELCDAKLDQDFDDTRIIGDYNAYDDLPTDNVDALKLAYVKNLNRFLESQIDAGTGALSWTLYSEGFPDEVVDPEGDIEIKPECAPLIMYRDEDPNNLGSFMLIPAILQVGTSAMHGIGENEFALRLSFYRGMGYQSDGSSLYPFSTSGNRNYSGSVIGDRTLWWHSEYGLIQTNWSRWLKAIHKAPKVTITVNFNLLDFINFKINKRFRYRTRNMLMRSIQYEMGSRIEPAKAEMILTNPVR